MISLTLALPIAWIYIQKLQVPEFFANSSSFRLIPPPAIINLQVDREQQLQPLVSKHLDGLNSQELRAQVVTKIENSPELKTEILAPYIQEVQLQAYQQQYHIRCLYLERVGL